MFQIEKSLPIPMAKRPKLPSKQRKFPVLEMAVGDSFFAPGYVPSAAQKIFGTEKTMSSARWRKLVPGSSWTVRTVVEAGVRGVRVWRVA